MSTAVPAAAPAPRYHRQLWRERVALLISLWLSLLDGWYTRTIDWFQLPAPKP